MPTSCLPYISTSCKCQVGKLLKETQTDESASMVPDEGLEFQDQESISSDSGLEDVMKEVCADDL